MYCLFVCFYPGKLTNFTYPQFAGELPHSRYCLKAVCRLLVFAEKKALYKFKNVEKNVRN